MGSVALNKPPVLHTATAEVPASHAAASSPASDRARPPPKLSDPISPPYAKGQVDSSIPTYPIAMDSKTSSKGAEKDRKPQAQVPIQRQIRFVRNDGHPYQKKRRILAACITCRKRKTRCSGEKPTCQTCSQSKQQCQGYRDKPAHTRPPSSSQKVRPSTPPSSGASGCSSQIDTTPTRSEATPSSSTAPHSGDRSESSPSQYGNDSHTIPDFGDDWISGCGTRSFNRMFDQRETAPQLRTPRINQSPALKNKQLANRVPFFRYFGRTAIVPGYKKVIVEMRHSRPSRRIGSANSSLSPASGDGQPVRNTPIISTSPESTENDHELPVYDPTDHINPVHPLIIHLVEVFFSFCGSSFPFLHPEMFIPAVKSKLVEAILVDSVCAVGARFSDHPSFHDISRTDAGTVFANRAKALVIDAFSHPNLGTTQALLLIAYFEFGQSKDSGLWNFTGTAIRFALDLGINRLEGMRGERQRRRQDAQLQAGMVPTMGPGCEFDAREDDLYDQECRDATTTFWAIFFLDRAISIGTGRTVTLRNDDIEIPMPPLEVRRHGQQELQPCPFAALIRVMSLYGRAADTINSIQKGASASQVAIQQLADLQFQSVATYRSFPPKLDFSIQNFEYYVQTNQSSVFLLLHLWFQALIILLHGDVSGVPELHGQNARQMSLMSAKTIVDVLKYASDREKKSIIANPFHSQPIYIAAKVFLDSEPSPDFLRCYKSIEEIDQYWSGVRYILTVLDQMLKGVDDPLLYLEEEEEQEPRAQDLSKGWSASGFAGEPNLDVTWIDSELMQGRNAVDNFLALTQSEMVDVESWDYDLGYIPEPGSWGDGLE